MYDIVGIDQPCVDLSVNLNKFPQKDGREHILNYSFQGGGKTATGLAAAASLGAACALVGNVGDDRLAYFCQKDLDFHGVDARYLIKRPQKYTSFSVVISEKETCTRCILPHRSNGERIRFDEIPEELFKNTKFLYISWVNDDILKAVRAARSFGAGIVIDADESTEGVNEILPLTDIFIASEKLYEKWFPGSADRDVNCRAVQAKGPGIVMFTMGGKGCFGMDENGFFSIPAYSVDIVDTLGAGDTFHGAFVAGRTMGMTAQDSARLASAAAAIKCTRIGGRAGIPDLKTVRTFMREGRIDHREIDRRAQFYKEGFENV